MADLLASVLDAHGGLDAWRSVEGITAAVTMGGPFWRRKGWPTPTVEYTIDIDPRRLHAELSPFTAPDVTLRLDGDRRTRRAPPPGAVRQPARPPALLRRPHGGILLEDPLRLGYFIGYAMWNYLTTPLLFTYPGVTSRELPDRRVEVTFPPSVATHTPTQVFYFDEDFRLTRIDYAVAVNGNSPAAHFTSDYRTFDGLAIPTRREVFRRSPDGAPEIRVITVDIHDVVVRRARG